MYYYVIVVTGSLFATPLNTIAILLMARISETCYHSLLQNERIATHSNVGGTDTPTPTRVAFRPLQARNRASRQRPAAGGSKQWRLCEVI